MPLMPEGAGGTSSHSFMHVPGRTAPVLPENIMSLLVPIEGTSDHQVDKIETFSRTTPSPAAAILDYFRSALISFQT